jgi:hypothetical protein
MPSKKPEEAGSKQLSLLLASVCFMLGLLFYSKDGGDMFLQNVWFSPNYTLLQPRRECYSTLLTSVNLELNFSKEKMKTWQFTVTVKSKFCEYVYASKFRSVHR